MSLVAILYFCGWETAEKRRLPQKGDLQEDSLHLLSGLQDHSISTLATFFSEGISRASVRKETKDNSGLETEHQGRSGSNFSLHAATSDAELRETLAGMC